MRNAKDEYVFRPYCKYTICLPNFSILDREISNCLKTFRRHHRLLVNCTETEHSLSLERLKILETDEISWLVNLYYYLLIFLNYYSLIEKRRINYRLQ